MTMPAVASKDILAAVDLPSSGWGHLHEHHDAIDSTNDRALAWLRETPPAPDGAVVTADRQHAGRGRLGRAWDSSGLDLYASVVVRPRATPHGIGALGLVVGLALAEAIEGVAPSIRVELKWPNDLWIGGRKVGGILCETRWLGDRPDIVVGFGINVGRERFEGELAERATSLQRELGEGRPGRASLLSEALRRLQARLGEFFAEGFSAHATQYTARCVSLGADVWVTTTRPDGRRERIAAKAESLDADGALRVRSAAGGPSFRVQSEDVWLARELGDKEPPC